MDTHYKAPRMVLVRTAAGCGSQLMAQLPVCCAQLENRRGRLRNRPRFVFPDMRQVGAGGVDHTQLCDLGEKYFSWAGYGILLRADPCSALLRHQFALYSIAPCVCAWWQ